MAAWETCEQIRKKNWMNALPLTQQRPITGRKKPCFNIGVKTLEWILGPHWTSALMYLGNGVGSKNSTKLIWVLDSGSKFEVRPRLRSSASTFFSPGIWWMLKKVLYWICLMQTSFIMSESFSVVEKPLLMFASAPVLSEPDWMSMIPGLWVDLLWTVETMPSCARASQEVM